MRCLTAPSEMIAAQHEHEHEVSDWSFRRPILAQWPDQFARQIANNYAELYQSEGRRIANLYMLDIKDYQSHHIIKLAASDSDLIAAAKTLSERCKRLRRAYTNGQSSIEEKLKINYRLSYQMMQTTQVLWV